MSQEFDPRDLEPALPREKPTSRSRLAPIIIAAVALAGSAGVIWYAYDRSRSGAVGDGGAPLIRAENGPIKVRPDQPGGLDVPHQDKLVLNELAAGRSAPPKVESLLPQPEAPLPRPGNSPGGLAASDLPPAISTAPPATAVRPNATSSIVAPLAPPSASGPLLAPGAAPGGAPRAQAIQPPPATPVPRAPVEPPPPVRVQPPAPVAAAPVARPAVAAVPPPAAPPAPAAAAPPRPAAAGGALRVQLASVKSPDAAQQEWSRLQKTHPELASLTMTPARVDLGPDRGVFYRIQAGPLTDQAAERLCTALKAKSQGCFVVHP